MPIGRVKWFDPDKGFGFVTNPGHDDDFVGTQVLPDGVEELHQGQKIEYEFAAGRKGPQVLRITDIQETGRPRRRPSHKYKPDQLQSMIQDLMTLLEGHVQPSLQAGRYPGRKESRQVAEVLRAVARELDV